MGQSTFLDEFNRLFVHYLEWRSEWKGHRSGWNLNSMSHCNCGTANCSQHSQLSKINIEKLKNLKRLKNNKKGNTEFSPYSQQNIKEKKIKKHSTWAGKKTETSLITHQMSKHAYAPSPATSHKTTIWNWSLFYSKNIMFLAFIKIYIFVFVCCLCVAYVKSYCLKKAAISFERVPLLNSFAMARRSGELFWPFRTERDAPSPSRVRVTATLPVITARQSWSIVKYHFCIVLVLSVDIFGYNFEFYKPWVHLPGYFHGRPLYRFERRCWLADGHIPRCLVSHWRMQSYATDSIHIHSSHSDRLYPRTVRLPAECTNIYIAWIIPYES